MAIKIAIKAYSNRVNWRITITAVETCLLMAGNNIYYRRVPANFVNTTFASQPCLRNLNRSLKKSPRYTLLETRPPLELTIQNYHQNYNHPSQTEPYGRHNKGENVASNRIP